MITGAHVLLYSRIAEADRKFIRDVLGFYSVDVGGGWLIFRLPPSEVAVHPAEEPIGQQHADHDLIGAILYFMCDDIHSTISELAEKGVRCTEVSEEPWGIKTTIPLPSGQELGLYEPRHPTAIE